MAWYFYNGRVPVPVRRVDGVVVSVSPRGYVEANPQDVRKFGSKMRRCAPPKEEVERAALVPHTVIEPPKSSSPMSMSIKEKGITSDPARPPSKSADKDVEKVASPPKKRRSRSRSTKKTASDTSDS